MTSTLFRHAVAEYSIILGGRVGVGKTSLYRRILYDTFSEDPRTVRESGLERGVYGTQVNGENVKVSLWDTGGLEKYTAMTSNYFRNSHAIILVYSVEEEDSLFLLQDWLTEARTLNPEHVVAALWGNKCDVERSSFMPEMVTAFSEQNKISPELVACVSAQTGEGVKEALEALVANVHSQQWKNRQRGWTLEPLIDPQLYKEKGRQCAC